MGKFKEFFLSKIFSRKLIVWAVATFLLCYKFIDENTWMILGLAYMGSNLAIAAIQGFKTNKEETVTTTSENEKEGEA